MRVGRTQPPSASPCRDAVVELGRGLDLALLAAGCQEQASGGPGLTPSRAMRVPVTPSRTGRDRWAPALPPGEAPSDRGRQRPPRPGCLAACQPVSPVRPRIPHRHPTLVTFPVTQRPSPCRGKGLDLRKLVAGRDLIPRPLGYEPYCDTRSHVVSERVEEVWLMPGRSYGLCLTCPRRDVRGRLLAGWVRSSGESRRAAVPAMGATGEGKDRRGD